MSAKPLLTTALPSPSTLRRMGQRGAGWQVVVWTSIWVRHSEGLNEFSAYRDGEEVNLEDIRGVGRPGLGDWCVVCSHRERDEGAVPMFQLGSWRCQPLKEGARDRRDSGLVGQRIVLEEKSRIMLSPVSYWLSKVSNMYRHNSQVLGHWFFSPSAWAPGHVLQCTLTLLYFHLPRLGES